MQVLWVCVIVSEPTLNVYAPWHDPLPSTLKLEKVTAQSKRLCAINQKALFVFPGNSLGCLSGLT